MIRYRILGEPLRVELEGPAHWHRATVRGFRVSILSYPGCTNTWASAWVWRPDADEPSVHLTADRRNPCGGPDHDPVRWLADLCEHWITHCDEPCKKTTPVLLTETEAGQAGGAS